MSKNRSESTKTQGESAPSDHSLKHYHKWWFTRQEKPVYTDDRYHFPEPSEVPDEWYELEQVSGEKIGQLNAHPDVPPQVYALVGRIHWWAKPVVDEHEGDDDREDPRSHLPVAHNSARENAFRLGWKGSKRTFGRWVRVARTLGLLWQEKREGNKTTLYRLPDPESWPSPREIAERAHLLEIIDKIAPKRSRRRHWLTEFLVREGPEKFRAAFLAASDRGRRSGNGYLGSRPPNQADTSDRGRRIPRIEAAGYLGSRPPNKGQSSGQSSGQVSDKVSSVSSQKHQDTEDKPKSEAGSSADGTSGSSPGGESSASGVAERPSSSIRTGEDLDESEEGNPGEEEGSSSRGGGCAASAERENGHHANGNFHHDPGPVEEVEPIYFLGELDPPKPEWRKKQEEGVG